MKKRDWFLIAFVKFAEMWACNNIGNNVEVDYEKLVNYVDSLKFTFFTGWDMDDDLYSCYERIEELILDGWPIWEMFRISEWTLNMLRRDFEDQVKKEQEPYCCHTCRHLQKKEVSLGVIYGCAAEIDEDKQDSMSPRRRSLVRKGMFKFKKTCKKYKEKEKLDESIQ